MTAEHAFVVALAVAILWVLSTTAALAIYAIRFDRVPDCEPRTIFVLPFILIGDVLTLAARKSTARLLHGVLFACAPELCAPECWE